MRILVIGGTGFIGPHVATRLSELGHQVTVFHRGDHETDLPPSVRHVHSVSAGWPVVEFPDELKRSAPDVVLHMVAIGQRDAEAVMSAFRGVAARLVAISSGDVYRAYGLFRETEAVSKEPALLLTEAEPLATNAEPLATNAEPLATNAEPPAANAAPLNEDAPLRQSLYPYRSASQGPDDWMFHYDKILVERAAMSDAGLPGTVLRLPAVYGPRDYHRLFPWLKRMFDQRPFILLEESYARWRWSHGYVENVAAAITLAVADERAAGRIYNVSEPATPAALPTVAEWVRAIGRAAAWSGKVIALPKERLPAHLKQDYNFSQDIVMDSSRIRTELGYTELVGLEEGLRRTIAWERAHPPEQFDAAQFDYAAEDAALGLAPRT